MGDSDTNLGPTYEDIACRLEIVGVDAASCRVAAFEAYESLSSLFRYRVTVATEPADVASLEKALGSAATFALDRAGTTERIVHGIVTEVIPDGATVGENQARTVVVVEPKLASLRHSGGYRIFQNQSVKAIIEAIVGPEKIDVAWRLRPDARTCEYRTQRDESDLDFVLRLASDEGLSLLFEHDDEKTTAVFTNNPLGFHKLEGKSTISFRDTGGATTGEHVRSVRRQQRIRTGAVEHRDYDFKNPRVALKGRAEVSSPHGEADTTRREIRDYPGDFIDPSLGTSRATARLEELRTDAFVFQGTASTLRFAPGRVFTLSEHADAAFNGDLVLTRVSMRGHVQGSFTVSEGARRPRTVIELASFEAVPGNTPIRPPYLAKPLGRLELARVVGPSEGDPHVDEFGRIKVQFMWDRDGKFDEQSSCWIRMMTPVGHGDEGFWSAHKVGSEVVIDFIDGDVDRPIVLGAVYNGKEKQPYKQPGKVSRSSWKIRGVPGGTGYNEITFECATGSEQIILHAQKDLNETILNDHNEDIGNDQTSKVGVNQKITVGTDRSLDVGNNETISIGTDQSYTIGSNQTGQIGSNRTTTIGQDESLTILGQATKMVATTDTVLVGAARSLTAASEAVTVGTRTKTVATSESTTIGTSRSESVGSDESISIGGQRSTSVGKDDALDVAKKLTISAGDEYVLKVGDDVSLTMTKGGDIQLKTGDATISMAKDGTISVKGKNVTVEASSNANVKGDKVAVKGSSVAVN